MQLIVGLGNPGERYARNRHNIGFMAVDAIARGHNAAPWRKRFHGLTSEAVIGGERVLLLLPQTFMNESGIAVAEAAQFYKIPLSGVAVLHDELDLAPAKLRVKTGGGNAGHNGLRSITAHIGNDYRRVRLGIGHPGDKSRVHAYVLGDFGKGECAWVDDLARAIADNAALLAKGDDPTFQNRVHLAMEARGWTDVKSVTERTPG
ncbi:PTH1 family peptidyl-tRNA hydrolase [Pseudochelatococcus lubricantis]|uniref:Peptidyl-tRNA hydrolase n=1 Tax=Pseudochelatococcus lubricantis TaxID=1538102 RepID=A0ABX0V2E5_9HYPH|nr:aminoacyl-tRNA hydrolase [Pseudochelatococcus lubricantis]NIJ59387.1 PTH1 family peptidyl-tRNA hydrolase [Pseudochelatococcus lubricantis]